MARPDDASSRPQSPLPGPEAGAHVTFGDHAAAGERARPGARAVLGALNEVARFLLELVLLGVFAWFGASLGSAWWSSTLIALAFVVAFALSWGALAAPRRLVATPHWFPSLLFVLLGALASLALWVLGHPVLAVALAVLVVLNEVLLRVLPSALRSVAASERPAAGRDRSDGATDRRG